MYDLRMTWPRIVKIIETLAALGIVERNYLSVRSFRRDLTLRVSPKHGVDRNREAPEPVCFVGVHAYDKPVYGIPRYLRLLGIFKNLDLMKEWHGQIYTLG